MATIEVKNDYMLGRQNETILYYKCIELEQENKKLKEDNKTFKFTIKTQQQMIDELINKIDKAIECIKNRNTTKSKKERFMSGETTLEKVLEILEDKE